MRSFLTLCLIVVTTTALFDPVVVKARGFVDVRAGQLVTPANILVEDGLIQAINPEPLESNLKVIDLEDKILMPGMMDMHVHLDLDFEKNLWVNSVTENASKGALRAAKNAEKTLLAGFTTVRNIGQTHATLELVGVAISEASEAGWLVAPRVIDCGHIISITGGHGDLSMGLGVKEGLIEYGPNYGMVNGADDAIQAVRFQIKHGARCIKMAATAGVLSLEESVGAQQLSNEEMQAIVEEANRHDITVAAHAHGSQGIIEAVKAGVRSIEHGSLLDKKGIRLMKKKGTYLVPTTGLVENILNHIDSLDPHMAEKGLFVLPKAQKNLSQAIKVGVKIAMGTDAPLVPHGKNAIELSAMIERGMSIPDALRSTTINAAGLLNLKDRGEIKEGYLADIIAVDDNPLEKVKTLEEVRFVMKGGRVYKREHL